MMNTIFALFQSTPNEVELATRKIVEMKSSVSKVFGELGRFYRQPQRDIRTAESSIDRWKEIKEEMFENIQKSQRSSEY